MPDLFFGYSLSAMVLTSTRPDLVPAAQASPARLAALDALRAVGAIAVVACHVGFNTGASREGLWGGLLARFDVGVAIFFALSGFLLFRPFAHAAATGGKRPAVRRYLWRRALRILPAYWLAVAGYLLLVEQPGKVTTLTWIDHLALTQVYGFGRFAEGFGHTWSLCTEVAFYFVLPAVAGIVLIGRWRPGRTIVTLAALGIGITGGWIALMSAGFINASPHGLWLPSYAGWFAAGMALAVAKVALETDTAARRFRVLDELASAPLACWLIAFAALAIATTPLAGPRDLRSPDAAEFAVKLVLYTVVAVMLLIPLAFGPANRFSGAFSSAPARWLGLVSYGLFLWHPLVIAFVYRPGGRQIFTGDFGSTFAIVLAAGLALATLSYYLLERPAQLLSRLGGSGRKRPAGEGKPQKADRAKAQRLGEPVDGALLSAPRGDAG